MVRNTDCYSSESKIGTDFLEVSTFQKQRVAFQTFTETPIATPSILGFGITHQPHAGGDGAKCGAKFADTLRLPKGASTKGISQREHLVGMQSFVSMVSNEPGIVHLGHQQASTPV
jgi:hypothetical protein